MARYNAKQRGIAFHFTLKEWVNWWVFHLGPNWKDKRGRYKGQFQMARNGDKGPYAPWNVKCITIEANLVDAQTNGAVACGERHKSSKLTEQQANEILKSAASARDMAKKHGVSVWAVWELRRGKTWAHLRAH